jgi:hypothetical protein
MTAKKKGGRPIGESLGGILAGFDQQIMRNQPPPHELVHKGAPVRGLSGEDGGEIEILLPGPEGAADPPAEVAMADVEEPTDPGR